MNLTLPDLIRQRFVAAIIVDVLRLRVAQLKRDRDRRRMHGRMQNEIEARLRKLHTKELLDMLHRHRWQSYPYHNYETHQTFTDDELMLIEWYAIKKVLATRPHVPNKVESRRKRQKIAVRQHGQGKSRNR